MNYLHDLILVCLCLLDIVLFVACLVLAQALDIVNEDREALETERDAAQLDARFFSRKYYELLGKQDDEEDDLHVVPPAPIAPDCQSDAQTFPAAPPVRLAPDVSGLGPIAQVMARRVAAAQPLSAQPLSMSDLA